MGRCGCHRGYSVRVRPTNRSLGLAGTTERPRLGGADLCFRRGIFSSRCSRCIHSVPIVFRTVMPLVLIYVSGRAPRPPGPRTTLFRFTLRYIPASAAMSVVRLRRGVAAAWSSFGSVRRAVALSTPEFARSFFFTACLPSQGSLGPGPRDDVLSTCYGGQGRRSPLFVADFIFLRVCTARQHGFAFLTSWPVPAGTRGFLATSSDPRARGSHLSCVLYL